MIRKGQESTIILGVLRDTTRVSWGSGVYYSNKYKKEPSGME